MFDITVRYVRDLVSIFYGYFTNSRENKLEELRTIISARCFCPAIGRFRTLLKFRLMNKTFGFTMRLLFSDGVDSMRFSRGWWSTMNRKAGIIIPTADNQELTIIGIPFFKVLILDSLDVIFNGAQCYKWISFTILLAAWRTIDRNKTAKCSRSSYYVFFPSFHRYCLYRRELP